MNAAADAGVCTVVVGLRYEYRGLHVVGTKEMVESATRAAVARQERVVMMRD